LSPQINLRLSIISISIFLRLAFNISAIPAATCPSPHRFSFTHIQIADVLKELQNLDPYKSAGLDNLDPLFLKLASEMVATPITSMFNPSFVSSEIPKYWKAAHPPLQRGCHSRPKLLWTILPCLSKIFESQVNKQITNHFETHHTFSTMQSGFRAGHGCTLAMLKVLNDIITAIDKRQYYAAIFIDLAKAFDSVNHRILIGRRNSLGFSNDCLAWFTHYFQIEFSVSNQRACCPDLWQSLWGCHRVQFSILALFSVYTVLVSSLHTH
jgi:hypothetical protein